MQLLMIAVYRLFVTPMLTHMFQIVCSPEAASTEEATNNSWPWYMQTYQADWQGTAETQKAATFVLHCMAQTLSQLYA